MGIAICYRRKFGQVWGSPAPLSKVAGKHRGRKTPPSLDLRLPQGKIVIILRCNPWAAGWSPEGTYYGVLYGENRPKSDNLATLTPRSSATVRRTKNLTGPRKLPGPWTTTWSKQYLSLQCIPWPADIACSE